MPLTPTATELDIEADFSSKRKLKGSIKLLFGKDKNYEINFFK